MAMKKVDSECWKKKVQYILQCADSPMLLGQRPGEWCGHGPVLEQDIALTNIALDLIGEARNFYKYAATLDEDKDEDYYPFLRYEWQFRNVQLAELPNKDFAYTIARHFLFDSFHYYFLQALIASNDQELKAIAEKSIKEVKYHLDFSSDWMIRLGDGTEESHQKMQTALNDYYPYSEEVLIPNDLDQWAAQNGIGVDLLSINNLVRQKRELIIEEATLAKPEISYFHRGGKNGVHTENMGFLITEMQYMQRAYPGAKW